MDYLIRVEEAVNRTRTRLIQFEEGEERLNKVKADIQKAHASIRNLSLALDLAKKCLEQSLQRRAYIEQLISQSLSEIYEEDYQFKLEILFDEEGTIKGIKPLLACGKGLQRNPLEAYGSGVSDVINILLYIISLTFSGDTERTLFLDEPLSHMDDRRHSRFEQLLKTVCSGLGLQIIMITHQSEPFGKIYRVKKLDGKSKVELL